MSGLLAAGLKRMIDICGAAVGLVILFPVFLVIGAIIKLDSAGPVFFRQERIGRNGKSFQILKFRSMRSGSEELLRGNEELFSLYMENDFKLPEGQDPRVTPIGGWLRKTSLDELPQLWNVLVGDMSLVGPRPLIRGEIDSWYGDRAQQLLSVRPGMTGLWQVSGRSQVGYPDRARMELEYVRSQTLWGDIQILVRTVQAVLTRRGAY